MGRLRGRHRQDHPAHPAATPRDWTSQLPPPRTVVLAGDELTRPGHLIRLFRDSYEAARGRQWLQAHMLWWQLDFLRTHGAGVDWALLESPDVAAKVSSMNLPRGHREVHPVNQAAMNFGLWWQLMAQIARLVYSTPPRPGDDQDLRLPDTAELREWWWGLGLRPWMSSSTPQESAGTGHALDELQDYRRDYVGPDDFMVRVLLPGLLDVELYWLHAGDDGRPRINDPSEVVLWRQHQAADDKWSRGERLTPKQHMYLRAGDILGHVRALPRDAMGPELRRIAELYDEL